jgi:hypothetical protein
MILFVFRRRECGSFDKPGRAGTQCAQYGLGTFAPPKNKKKYPLVLALL